MVYQSTCKMFCAFGDFSHNKINIRGNSHICLLPPKLQTIFCFNLAVLTKVILQALLRKAWVLTGGRWEGPRKHMVLYAHLACLLYESDPTGSLPAAFLFSLQTGEELLLTMSLSSEIRHSTQESNESQ